MKKQNLGKSIKDIEAIRGVTPFVADYVTQHGLGGHAIPLSQSMIDVLMVLGVVTRSRGQAEPRAGARTCDPQSQRHRVCLAAAPVGRGVSAVPCQQQAAALLLQIAPDAKERLAKRLAKPAETPPPPEPETKRASSRSARPTALESAPPAAEGATPKRKRTQTPEETGRAKAKAESPPDETSAAAAAKTSATKQLSKKKPR